MSSFVRALFFFFEEISSPCRLKHEKKFQCLFSMLGRHLQVHHFVWRIFHENRVCLHITDWSVLTISRQFLTLGHFLWLSVHIQWFHTKYFGCFVYMCVVNSLFSTYSICYLKVEFRNITLRHYPKLHTQIVCHEAILQCKVLLPLKTKCQTSCFHGQNVGCQTSHQHKHRHQNSCNTQV